MSTRVPLTCTQPTGARLAWLVAVLLLLSNGTAFVRTRRPALAGGDAMTWPRGELQ